MGATLLIAGCLLALSNANRLRLALASRQWPSVAGSVAETATRDASTWTINGVGPSPWQDVLYRYSVDGKYFTGSRRYFGGFLQHWWQSITRSSHSYHAAADVLVKYKPENPKLAVLESGVPLGLAADYIVSVTLTIVGVWLLAAA